MARRNLQHISASQSAVLVRCATIHHCVLRYGLGQQEVSSDDCTLNGMKMRPDMCRNKYLNSKAGRREYAAMEEDDEE